MRRTYPHDHVQTPCERLRGLDCSERFLRPDVTIHRTSWPLGGPRFRIDLNFIFIILLR